MIRFVFFSLVLFFFLGGGSLCKQTVFFPVEEYLNNVHAQTPKRESSKTDMDLPSNEKPPTQGYSGRMITGERMGGVTAEGTREMMGGMDPKEMGERMKDFISPKKVPFYQEKTFLVIVTAAFVLVVAWMIKRWGIRPWKSLKKEGSFVSEAILVVDLCGSTKLAVTQGDVFAMRIKNKMKGCAREVSEGFGAIFFENIGDGYLITFSSGSDAVRAAVKILQNAQDYNKDVPEKEKIELRIGINYGEVVLDGEGGRHGATINKAFRIEGLRKGEQQSLDGGLNPEDFPEKNRIFVSEEMNEEIKGFKEIETRPVGVFDLKGFTGLHRIYYIPWKELPRD
jgi:class 3 adenylate cyclase